MDINVTLQQASEPVAVMHLQGNINASNFMQIVDKAQEIYKNPARNLILDLSDVSSISSTGIAAIHKIALIYSGVSGAVSHPDQTHSSSARKYVKVLSPQPEVEKALETAGLKLFFKVFRDLESALKSF